MTAERGFALGCSAVIDRTILDGWRRLVLALELLHSCFGFDYAVRLNFEMSNFLSVAYVTSGLLRFEPRFGPFTDVSRCSFLPQFEFGFCAFPLLGDTALRDAS
jgi:hypothetical protein